MAKSKKPKKAAKAKKAPKKSAAKKSAAKKPKPAAKAKAKQGKKPTKPIAAKAKKPGLKKTSALLKAKTKPDTAVLALDDPNPGLGGPGAQINASPHFTSPANGSSQTGGQNLAVAVTINLDSVNYQLELTDTSGSPPFPAPFTQTVTITPPAGSFNATIPAAQIQSGKTYQLKVKVHPSSGTTPPHNTDQVTFTTP